MLYHIFYASNPTFRSNPNLTRINFISTTHTFVKNVKAENPEQVFAMMQGEVWSPNGEARNLIKQLGLQHTSMSVGDIIIECHEDAAQDIAYEVIPFGFRRIQ